jgi:hypothetical protein
MYLLGVLQPIKRYQPQADLANLTEKNRTASHTYIVLEDL